MRRGPLTFGAVLLLAFVARAGGDDYDLFASGLRADRPDARRAALERYLADPALVPENRRDRAQNLLLSALDKDREPDIRGLAARCLAVHRSTEVDVRIVRRLVAERNWRAQRPMIAALTGITDETVLALVEKNAFREPRPDVRALWVEMLGRFRVARAPDVLRKLAAVRLPWPVAQAAAIALGRHPSAETVDRLIDLLWSEDHGVRAAARESLVRITGQWELGLEPAKWVKWWAENREKFAPVPRPAPKEAEVETKVAETPTVPTYYDIPIRGSRVIFCLDISASMWGAKFNAARAELSRAIRTLTTGHRFNVIFFNEHPYPWTDGLVPAYPFQKLECVTSFEELTTKKYTNIFDTLERALGFAGIGRFALEDPPGVDDVFILTDGEPNRGRRRDAKGILAGLKELDPGRRVRIHAISIGDVPKGLMAAIAKQQGGRHAHVEAKR